MRMSQEVPALKAQMDALAQKVQKALHWAYDYEFEEFEDSYYEDEGQDEDEDETPEAAVSVPARVWRQRLEESLDLLKQAAAALEAADAE